MQIKGGAFIDILTGTYDVKMFNIITAKPYFFEHNYSKKLNPVLIPNKNTENAANKNEN